MGQPGPSKKVKMSCGVYMACSYFEGYLAHVIPSNGANFVGFQENLSIFEAKNQVCFPVKKLFVIIPKSLYCPPDLGECDIGNIEAVRSFEDVMKDVAGVKNRTYRMSAYKIRRGGGRAAVHVAAECATPLRTLHEVRQKRAVYQELSDVDIEEVVRDFCSQLELVVERSPECRGKCVLVHYDDTDPTQSLSNVLLEKIKTLQPDFEDIIASYAEMNLQ